MAKKIELNTEKIRKECYGRGQELADKLGIHRVTLSRKLNAKLDITLRELNAIGEHLGRDVSEFLIEVS
ncbi:helix-turn-helix transcriptional regulator [Candidatus Poribacteria bacterium]|nr:helix-turn-helix transcriptional regulator [Candidatus Poribacteria bacterium]